MSIIQILVRGHDDYECLIGGEPFHGFNIVLIGVEPGDGKSKSKYDFEIIPKNPRAAKVIQDCGWANVSSEISNLTFRNCFDWSPFNHAVTFGRDTYTSPGIDNPYGRYSEEINIALNGNHWPYPWEITDYCREFGQVLTEQGNWGVCSLSPADMVMSVSSFQYNLHGEVDRNNRLFSESLASIGERIKQIHEEAVARLELQRREGTVVVRFNFPSSIRVPCEQYLLYFAEFLKDIGVQVATDITHKAGVALFTVIPGTPDVALENIYDALAIYLKLPTNPAYCDSSNAEMAFEVQRLTNEVRQFRDKLASANMVMKAQHAIQRANETTIQAQEVIIQTQKERIDQLSNQPRLLPPPELFNPHILVSAVQLEESNEATLNGGNAQIDMWNGPDFQLNASETLREAASFFKREKND